jgi:hypothetical protein
MGWLVYPAIGQSLREQLPGPLGQCARLFSQFSKEVNELLVVGSLSDFGVLLIPSSILQDAVECSEDGLRFGLGLGGAPVIGHPALLSLGVLLFDICLLHIHAQSIMASGVGEDL